MLAITVVLGYFVLLLLFDVAFGFGVYLSLFLCNIAFAEMRLIEMFNLGNLLL